MNTLQKQVQGKHCNIDSFIPWCPSLPQPLTRLFHWGDKRSKHSHTTEAHITSPFQDYISHPPFLQPLQRLFLGPLPDCFKVQATHKHITQLLPHNFHYITHNFSQWGINLYEKKSLTHFGNIYGLQHNCIIWKQFVNTFRRYWQLTTPAYLPGFCRPWKVTPPPRRWLGQTLSMLQPSSPHSPCWEWLTQLAPRQLTPLVGRRAATQHKYQYVSLPLKLYLWYLTAFSYAKSWLESCKMP